jgi:hypothetical protein
MDGRLLCMLRHRLSLARHRTPFHADFVFVYQTTARFANSFFCSGKGSVFIASSHRLQGLRMPSEITRLQVRNWN